MMKKYSRIITFVLLFILVFGIGASITPQHALAFDCSASNPAAYANPICGLKGFFEATGVSLVDVIGTVISPITNLVLTITSLITGLSGIILNYVVNYTIVDMSKNYTAIPAINTAWSTLRDVANMGFIFVLLYASIQLILGIGKDTRKLIVNIIIIAILINFSLFFTKVVIDASNILAVTFYNAMVPGGTAGTPGQFLNAGLSNALMQPLDLQSIWKMAGTIDGKNLVTIGVLGSIVSLIAAFVFFAIAMMFVIRYVVLIFVLILSPIAFVSWIIPGGFGGIWNKWKDALLNQAFFAPVYMLLTWITISIFQSLPGLPGSTVAGTAPPTSTLGTVLSGTMTTTATGGQTMQYSQDSMGLLFNFVVVIVFLIATLMISKSMANKAGPMASKATGMLTGFAGGVAFGGVGMLGRASIGRIGSVGANNAELIQKVESGNATRGERLKLWASRKAAGATFDPRNAAVSMPDIIAKSKIGRALDLDTLGPIKVGEMAAELSGAGVGKGTTKGGITERAEAREKRVEADKKKSDEAYRKAKSEASIKKGLAEMQKPVALRNMSIIAEMQKTVKDMSSKEILALDHNTLVMKEVAEALTAQHLKAINDSDRPETEKRKIFEKHFDNVSTAVEALSNPAVLATLTPAQITAHKNTIKNISEKEMDFVPTSIIDPNRLDPTTPEGRRGRTFLETITQAQVDGMTKGDRFIASEKQAIKDERTRPLNDDFNTDNWTGAIARMREMSVENLVKLDPVKLANPGILDLYRPALLNKMAARSELTDTKANTIRGAIILAGSAPGASPEVIEAKNWLEGDGLQIF